MAAVERLRESLSWLQQIQQAYHCPQQNNGIYDNSSEFYQKPMFDCPENNDFESLILNRIDNVGFSSTEISTSSPPMVAKESSRKRKTAVMFDATEDYCKNKKSKDTDEKSNKGSSRTSSISKDSEVQKTDYIHVRARRGQATDNHSLAERARREKIGKKMKCLQDLVPGCDKISGKAGMLDEIINYVQSLQTQVEFLSMRIATLNPRFDFINGNLCAKEFLAYADNFPAADMSSPEMGSLGTMQFNAMLQQGLQSCALDTPMTQKNTRAIMTLPQTQPFPGWDIDWQTYNTMLSSNNYMMY